MRTCKYRNCGIVIPRYNSYCAHHKIIRRREAQKEYSLTEKGVHYKNKQSTKAKRKEYYDNNYSKIRS
jgi:hypothetical protein